MALVEVGIQEVLQAFGVVRANGSMPKQKVVLHGKFRTIFYFCDRFLVCGIRSLVDLL